MFVDGFLVAYLVHGVGWGMSTPCLPVNQKTEERTFPICPNQEQIDMAEVSSAVMANMLLLLFEYPYRNQMLH